MFRCLSSRLCLSFTCLSFLARITGAQNLQQSVAITMDPGQSTVESFQLTVPVVAQTTTEISMITVTQVSMQTSTVMSMVTQMQTVTVPGTCAAATQAVMPQSSLAVVTAGALNQIDTTASEGSIGLSSTATAGISGSSAIPAAPSSDSAASSGPCDCSCLCPIAAFPMAANTSQTAPVSDVQMSTFQMMASADVANKAVMSSSIESPPASSAAATTSMTDASTNGAAATASSQPGVLPSVIVTDPGTPTGRAQIQDAQDAPFNINTYQLMKSVGLPVAVGRAVEPSTAV